MQTKIIQIHRISKKPRLIRNRIALKGLSENQPCVFYQLSILTKFATLRNRQRNPLSPCPAMPFIPLRCRSTHRFPRQL